MSLLILKIKVYPTNKALILFEKKIITVFVFLSFSHGQCLCRLHQSWQRAHINIGGICISALNHINAFIFFSFECNFLNVTDVIFPVWKESLAAPKQIHNCADFAKMKGKSKILEEA